MKKKSEKIHGDELRKEYDFSKLPRGIVGKYAKQYREGHNIILLEPDVADVFHDEKSVNNALRALMKVAKAQVAHAG